MGIGHNLEEMATRTLEEIRQSRVMPDLETIRIKILGKKGELTASLRGMKDIPAEDRPKFGEKSE